MEADGRIEANLEASGLGRFPPPLMVAGQEAFPLSLVGVSGLRAVESRPKPLPPMRTCGHRMALGRLSLKPGLLGTYVAMW